MTFKKVVHKAAEATSEFIRNKTADKIVKAKQVIDEKFWTNNYSTKKKEEMLSELRLAL